MKDKSVKKARPSRAAKKTEVKYSYRSGWEPTLVIEFKEPQAFGWGYGVHGKRKTVSFSGSQEENSKEKWVQWGNFGINFYFTTNKGQSWKDSIKYAKAWVTRNMDKSLIKSVTVEWENPAGRW